MNAIALDEASLAARLERLDALLKENRDTQD